MAEHAFEVGHVEAEMGETIHVGVDCGAVGIYIGGWLSADGITLGQRRAEEFGRLFVAACWEAGRNAQRIEQESAGALKEAAMPP